MKKLYVSLLFCFIFALKGYSQPYFIYIQSENKQPFSVVVNGKSYHSSTSGYVVIPKLFSGNYKLEVETYKKEKITYSVKLDKKDLGLSLEENVKNQLVLVSLQSKEPLDAQTASGAEEPPVVNVPAPKKQAPANGGFSQMLNVEDKKPQVIQPVAAVEPKTVEPAIVADTPAAKTASATAKAAPVDETEDSTPVAVNTRGIIKTSQKYDKDGVNIRFIDFNSKGQDTIDVLIPAIAEDAAEKATEVVKAAETQPSLPADTAAAKSPEPSTSTLQVSVSESSPAATDSVANPFQSEAAPAKRSMNTNCNALADEEDFLQLRKKLASGKTHEKMTAIAVRTFKSTCFSTAQIKSLGHLFLNDQARFTFFESAYPYVADPENYMMLEVQLLDVQFKEKLRQLINQ